MINQEWLDERLAYWQRVLRLEDYRIVARFVDAHELTDDGDGIGLAHSNARVRVDPPSRHARIKIVKPDQVPPIVDVIPKVDPISNDPEVFLVHELLHISLWDADMASHAINEEIFELAQERHIIVVSKALVSLDRGNQRAGL